MRKTLVALALLAGAAVPALAQRAGPGPAPGAWQQAYPDLFYNYGGIRLPFTVPGGSKGPGTINAAGFYLNGVLITSIPVGPANMPAFSGDCASAAGTTTLTCTKTQGAPFAPSATTDTTNASNSSSGTLPAGRLPAFTGDVTSALGTSTLTLPTVNSTPGSFGGASSVPTLTTTGKGLVTATGAVPVVAPAGTLSGTTLAANVISTSITSVGTIASGVWNGTAINPAYIATGTSGATLCLLNASCAVSGSYAYSGNNTHTGSESFTGATTAPTVATADNSTNVASTANVVNKLAAYAPLASPAFTGTPTAPTATAGTSTTQVATTAFVQSGIAAATAAIPRGYIGGLGTANDTTNPNTVIVTAVGQATSDDATTFVSLGAPAYKSIASTWSAGAGTGASPVGGLDTGTVAASTWYYVFLIYNPTTPAADVLYSASATSPTLPSGYTKKRRIGAVRTNGSSQITTYVQTGDRFDWATPVQDVPNVTTTTTGVLNNLSVPPAVNVEAIVSGITFDGSNANTVTYLSSPLQADVAVGGPGTNALTVNSGPVSTSGTFAGVRIVTASGQIRRRSSAATAALYVNTSGWIDTRGR